LQNNKQAIVKKCLLILHNKDSFIVHIRTPALQASIHAACEASNFSRSFFESIKSINFGIDLSKFAATKLNKQIER